MRIFDKILEKWNIIYATIFVVGTGLLVDIWAGYATTMLFVIAILTFLLPYLQKFVRYMEE